MEYKEAISVLTGLLKKYALNAEEKEAVLTAIGILDWGSIAKKSAGRKMKAWKSKKEKDAEWH